MSVYRRDVFQVILIEVVFFASFNLFQVKEDVVIAIRPRLLMINAKGVHKLMLDCYRPFAPITNRNILLRRVDMPNVTPASSKGVDRDEIIFAFPWLEGHASAQLVLKQGLKILSASFQVHLGRKLN